MLSLACMPESWIGYWSVRFGSIKKRAIFGWRRRLYSTKKTT